MSEAHAVDVFRSRARRGLARFHPWKSVANIIVHAVGFVRPCVESSYRCVDASTRLARPFLRARPFDEPVARYEGDPAPPLSVVRAPHMLRTRLYRLSASISYLERSRPIVYIFCPRWREYVPVQDEKASAKTIRTPVEFSTRADLQLRGSRAHWLQTRGLGVRVPSSAQRPPSVRSTGGGSAFLLIVRSILMILR